MSSSEQLPGDGQRRLEYRLSVRLGDGRVVRSMPFLTHRSRGVGDEVRIPIGPDGELRPGELHAWRVVAVGENGTLLVLEHDARRSIRAS
jgi:hypothetical protein